MNADDARRLAQAQADYLADDGAVLVTTDVSTSNEVMEAFLDGLRLQGRDVLVRHDMSFEDTARAVTQFNVAGGAHISAGSVVMIAPDGDKLPVDVVMDIMQAAEADNFVPSKEQGSILHEPPAAE